jgi:transcription antitermination factor NusG
MPLTMPLHSSALEMTPAPARMIEASAAWSAGAALDASASRLPWYAVRVRSNAERLVHASLTGKQYESFLPTYRSRRRWSDRVRELDVPLFPGYTFCRFDARTRLPILTTPGVVSIISSSLGPIEVDPAELASVRTLIASGALVGPWPFLREGQLVSVEKGPLCGVEGIVVNVKNQYRLVVSVSLLQRSIAVEIDRDWVAPIPNRC